MHLASFSLSTSASVRGSPENDVVYLLLDEILVDGFVTQGEPLLLTQPADLIAEAEAVSFLTDFVQECVFLKLQLALCIASSIIALAARQD